MNLNKIWFKGLLKNDSGNWLRETLSYRTHVFINNYVDVVVVAFWTKVHTYTHTQVLDIKNDCNISWNVLYLDESTNPHWKWKCLSSPHILLVFLLKSPNEYNNIQRNCTMNEEDFLFHDSILFYLCCIVSDTHFCISVRIVVTVVHSRTRH